MYYLEKSRTGEELNFQADLKWDEKSEGKDKVCVNHPIANYDATKCKACMEQKCPECFPKGSIVLIADDFTNSGTTLANAVEFALMLRPDRVILYITHFVGLYSPPA